MVRHMLASSHKGNPITVYRASFMYIPTHKARTNLTDALKYLRNAKEDCVVLVLMHSEPMYSPQPQQGKYYTMLPINGNPGAGRGSIGSFATATLPIASRQGRSGDMAIRIKLPPCFGSSKRPKTELIEEAVLVMGPLWKNACFIECNGSNVVLGKTGKNAFVRRLSSTWAIQGPGSGIPKLALDVRRHSQSWHVPLTGRITSTSVRPCTKW